MTRVAVYSVFALAVLIVAFVFVVPLFEWYAPAITIKLDSDYVSTRPVNVEITDKGRGLKKASITLTAGGSEYRLFSEEYDSPVREKHVTVMLSPKGEIPEGLAVLRVTAWDYSYWKFFKGNKTSIEKEVTVDLTPPTLQLVIGDRYVSFGGSGLVLYRSSPDTVKSGVEIGEYYFPGYKGVVKDPDIYAVFFAHPYDVPPGEKAAITAQDPAGNSAQFDLSYVLQNVRYKKRTVQVSGNYIQQEITPLLAETQRQGSLKDIFLKVNRYMRKENEAEIRKLCAESKKTILWSGAFHQLSNSKVQANFADQRTYVYKGEIVDHAFHLGYDLAVTRNYPIEAANNGVVVFTGDLGIYGNTVIMDHGLGLFTMYSHMSSISVKEGDKVERKQIIGKTGKTGLATGDHLHYATLIHGVPVLPVEWWDAKWIKDNIMRKIEDLESSQ